MNPFLQGLLFAALLTASLHAEDAPAEHPAAKQFREHLQAADTDKDGFVTLDELGAEVSKIPAPQRVGRSVDAMMAQLDADKDGKLSAAEVAHGVTVTGQKAAAKESVRRAREVMEALGTFKKERGGTLPAKLDELVKLKWIDAAYLNCTMADGKEKPWGYTTENGTAETAILLFSPGPVDADGQYLVGMGDGSVAGMTDKDLDLEKIPHLKANILRDKQPEK